MMELLTVIAILAVLIAIIIPVFSGYLEKSREAVDLANVRSAYSEVAVAVSVGDTERAVKVVSLKAEEGRLAERRHRDHRRDHPHQRPGGHRTLEG